MIPTEETIESKKIFEGKVVTLRVDTVQLFDKQATREIIEHSGGVGIVPITCDRKIVMVKQFRKPAEKPLLEIPAGKLEKGEEPKACAIRELKEETGYTANEIKHLSSFFPSPGFSNERLHVYMATDLLEGEATPDEGEYVEVQSYSIEEAMNMIGNGMIEDAKTIIGILMARNYLLQNKK